MTHALYDVGLGGLATGLAVTLLWRGYAARVRLQRQVARLEVLNEIGRVLLTDRNARGVMRHVVENASQLLHCDMAHVTLVTPDASRLVLEAATGPLAPLAGAAVPTETSASGWVIANSQQLVLNDPARAETQFRALDDRIPLRRTLIVPLMAKGRCIGALGVDNPRDHRAFDADDATLLGELANYAALAIESIQAVGELGEREWHVQLLNAINSRIRQSLDLTVILDAAVREVGSALKASRCFVRLRRGADLAPAAGEWRTPETPGLGVRPDPAQGLLLTAVRERRTVVSEDARAQPAAAGADGPLAAVAVPIVLRGEAIGVIALHQIGLPRYWRPAEVGLVEEVASELAIAISNARLYQSVEEASRELATKINELERANRMKAQFLANMSHELRTPLNSVIGFSEMLLAGAMGSLTTDMKDALDTVARNGRHLLGLVNDILDLSKVDAGRMDLHLVPTDVRRLIPDVLAGMESLVQAKGLRISVEIADGPLAVRADEMRVRQVLYNLLSNAVKFTPAGGAIAVSALPTRAALPANGGRVERDAVRVAVADTGIGIAVTDLPRLFEEFSQLDATFARRHEGTGLGLALVKRFVELHGGQIGVESALGRGSTFWIELPVDGPPLAAPAAT
jgi:signal transduction histidine kinase